MISTPAPQVDVGGIAADQLRSFMERIDRLETFKADLVADIADVYAEAKSAGFDVKVMRKLARMSRLDRDDLIEQDETLELYRRAINI